MADPPSVGGHRDMLSMEGLVEHCWCAETRQECPKKRKNMGFRSPKRRLL